MGNTNGTIQNARGLRLGGGAAPSAAAPPPPTALSQPVKTPSLAGSGDKFDSFVERMSPAAEKAANKLGVPVEAVLSQWAYESGYGKSELSAKHNNFGGIKAGSSWNGKTAEFNTKEKNQTVTERAKFRSYDSPEAYSDDYAALLGNKRYSGVGGAKTTREFGERLGKAGYHQDDVGKYADALDKISERLTPLYKKKKQGRMVAVK